MNASRALSPRTLAIVTALLFCVLWRSHISPVDFSAFYCGGAVASEHQDPYAVAPLQSCEAGVLRGFHLALFHGETIPAPFPVSSLAFFALLSSLPPSAAYGVWMALNGVAYIAMLFALRRITQLPYMALAAATAIPELFIAMSVGQITPLVIGSITVATWAAVARYPCTAAVLMSISLLEPHLGIPAWLGLFVAVPRARVVLAMCAAVLGSVLVVFAPVSRTIEYVAVIVPAHARAEIFQNGQLSLAHFLAEVGVPPSLAVSTASIQYVLMIVAGLFFTRRLATMTEPSQRALAILCTPAFAACGGTFLHVQQVAIETVACCVLFSVLPNERERLCILTAIVCLAVPLETVFDGSDVILCTLIALSVVVSLAGASRGKLLMTTLTALCVTSIAHAVVHARAMTVMAPAAFEPLLLQAQSTARSAEDPWRVFSQLHFSWLGPASLFLQLPMLCAIVFTVMYIARLAAAASIHAAE